MKKYIPILLLIIPFCAFGQIWNGPFKKTTVYIDNRTSNGNIGTAFNTVDASSSFAINQTSPNKILTLPTPEDTTSGDDVTIRNIGTAYFTMYNVKVYPDSFEIHLTWKENKWIPVGGSGNGDCGCCDSLRFYQNDVEANGAGLNQGNYYLNDKNNDYGMAWGIVKVLTEDLPFDGSLPPGCIANVPDTELLFYKSDEDAKTAGLSIGEYYLLNEGNYYAMATGTIKQITEP